MVKFALSQLIGRAYLLINLLRRPPLSAKRLAMFWAAAKNHIDTVELLIKKGAYIDAGAAIGGSPLARAAYEGHVEIVELLIEHGANVNTKDGIDRTVLDAADDSVVPILRRHGAVKQR